MKAAQEQASLVESVVGDAMGPRFLVEAEVLHAEVDDIGDSAVRLPLLVDYRLAVTPDDNDRRTMLLDVRVATSPNERALHGGGLYTIDGLTDTCEVIRQLAALPDDRRVAMVEYLAKTVRPIAHESYLSLIRLDSPDASQMDVQPLGLEMLQSRGVRSADGLWLTWFSGESEHEHLLVFSDEAGEWIKIAYVDTDSDSPTLVPVE